MEDISSDIKDTVEEEVADIIKDSIDIDVQDTFQDISDTSDIQDVEEDDVPPCDPPVILNNLGLDEEPDDFIIKDTTGYIVTNINDQSGSLIVIDLSDPARPAIHHTEILQGIGEDLELYQSDYLLIANGLAGLQIWNISLPLSPGLISSIDTAYAKGVTAHGNYAYVGDGYQGIKIIDIDNPFAPSLVSQYDTGDFAKDSVVYQQGGNIYLYVADENDGVVVIDVTDATNPTHITTVSIPQGDPDIQAVKLDIMAPWLFVSLLKGGLNIYDITDPSQPQLIASITPGFGYVYQSMVSGTYLFVAAGFQGVQIYDISDIRNPAELYTLDTLGNTKRLLYNNNYLYVLDGDDINTPGLQSALRTVDLKCYTP